MLHKILRPILVLCVLSFTFNAAFAVTPSQEKGADTFVQAPGAELYCNIKGSGDPIIVIHGGAGYLTHDYLLPHMDLLARNNRVIFYDQRTLGRSSGEPTLEYINLKTFVDDIDTIRSSLGYQKVTLLGHSWGSFLALHYAIAHPESVDRLILVSSMPAASSELGLFFAEYAKRIAPYQEEVERMEASALYLSGNPQMVEAKNRIVFRTYMYQPDKVDALNLSISQKTALNGFKVWEIFKEKVFMISFDLSCQLGALRCPTLIVHGDSDIIPFPVAENLNKAIPSSKLVKIDQCGHFPFVEQPDTFFKALDAFLESAPIERSKG